MGLRERVGAATALEDFPRVFGLDTNLPALSFWMSHHGNWEYSGKKS